MKITYKFVDGETSTAEVDDEIGSFILDSRREEDNAERKDRYHGFSLDAITYEGGEFGRWDSYPSEEDSDERVTRILDEIKALPEPQQRRLLMHMMGKTYRQIAEAEGVSFQCIGKSIAAAQKKFEKFRH